MHPHLCLHSQCCTFVQPALQMSFGRQTGSAEQQIILQKFPMGFQSCRRWSDGKKSFGGHANRFAKRLNFPPQTSLSKPVNKGTRLLWKRVVLLPALLLVTCSAGRVVFTEKDGSGRNKLMSEFCEQNCIETKQVDVRLPLDRNASLKSDNKKEDLLMSLVWLLYLKLTSIEIRIGCSPVLSFKRICQNVVKDRKSSEMFSLAKKKDLKLGEQTFQHIFNNFTNLLMWLHKNVLTQGNAAIFKHNN